ncbi:hypothetical protein M0638_06190 [Roseomonas sp. NAR14]|uniref:Molybdopterin oxidoreductase n=1 Tax=Roseomonas acroporae TaxID=2937791 RepID=A0A9X1Y6F3_9PROT|nr:hypothetical protein [Roseomonas acroporae]MCK8783968.1 hypothetical protein [Roseomonas acroporae]
METTSHFINGIFPFSGTGLAKPAMLDAATAYTVPSDKRAQLIYFRAGNSADALVSVSLTKDGKPMRMFPIGAKSAVHVPLAVVEDIFPESRIEVLVAAPEGVSGEIVLDIGLLEV